MVINDDLSRLVVSVRRRWLAEDPLPRRPRGGEHQQDVAAQSATTGGTTGHLTSITTDEYVAQVLAAFAAQECGHALGLRHHCEASATTPREALTNSSYIKLVGISASAMEYPPRLLLLPSSSARPQQYFTSPVVDAYDKKAIRYGYDRSLSSPEVLDVHAAAGAAEGYVVASDGDIGWEALAIR